MNRSIRRLFMTMSIGFGLLVLMLGYWQVVDASSLRDRAGNQQTAQAERLIDRGRILTSDGKVLAASRERLIRGQKVFQRLYPQGSLAAHVVGYTSEERGKTGIESFYNRYLTGSFGTEPLLQRLRLREKRGADVVLSLDSRVQAVAQQHLSGQRGAVVALDPTTGQVLAMASTPGYDASQILSDYPSIASQQGAPLLNRATQGRYAPGSTFKVVTATSALDSGVYTPESSFPGGSSFSTPGGAIRNFGGARYGPHSFTTALTRSINTTFARIGQVLGPNRLGAAMDAYGFGRRTPLDLPDDQVVVSGRYRDGNVLPNDEQGEDAARIAIGQERLDVTPLQMAMVAAAVANRGTLMEPHIMATIRDRGGDIVERSRPVELSQVTSAEHAAQLTDMMEDVVREGTATRANLQTAGVTVAGKTGTAETGQTSRNNAWFIGFAPAERPVVAVAVVIEGTSATGGEVAAPVAADVIKAAIQAR